MIRLINDCIILLMLAMGCSCRSVRYVPVKNDIDSIVIEKLVEIPLPSDSTAIHALLECDERGRVVLSWLDMVNSNHAKALLTIDSLGNLIAKMHTQPDTVRVPSKEVIVTKEVQVPVPVEKTLNRWDKIKIELGGWVFGVLILFSMVVVGVSVFKKKKK